MEKTQAVQIDLSEFIERNPLWRAGMLDIMSDYHSALKTGDKDLAASSLATLREFQIDPESEGYISQGLEISVGVAAWSTFMARAFAEASDTGIDAAALIAAKVQRKWDQLRD